MPTGYTAKVCDGSVTDPVEFVWQCARAFGAFIMQRDDPSDAVPEMEEEPSAYHRKAIEKAESELARVSAMTDEEWAAFAESRRREDIDRHARYAQEKAETRNRLVTMRERVARLTIPHKPLADFIKEQIESTIKFDCSPYELRAFDQTRAEYTDGLRRDLAYAREQWTEEVERVESRNEWKRQLAEAIGTP